MTIRQIAAVVAAIGGGLLVAGVALVFGVPGGLISAGVLLIAAGSSQF